MRSIIQRKSQIIRNPFQCQPKIRHAPTTFSLLSVYAISEKNASPSAKPDKKAAPNGTALFIWSGFQQPCCPQIRKQCVELLHHIDCANGIVHRSCRCNGCSCACGTGCTCGTCCTSRTCGTCCADRTICTSRTCGTCCADCAIRTCGTCCANCTSCACRACCADWTGSAHRSGHAGRPFQTAGRRRRYWRTAATIRLFRTALTMTICHFSQLLSLVIFCIMELDSLFCKIPPVERHSRIFRPDASG